MTQLGSLPYPILCLSALAFVAASPAALADGAATFQQQCAACHGDKGQGIEGLAPPLKGSAFVAESSEEQLKAQILKGRTGKSRRFRDIPGGMPGVFVPEPALGELVKYVKGDLQK